MSSIYQVVDWVRTNGDIHAISRLRLKVLATTLKEGVALGDVTPETKCSRECLDRVRQAASEVVGKPCPR